MKIERINEDQIRCTLTSFELSMRNLNLSELAYGSDKARNLFREMIQRAASEVGFDAEDIPLMVEAIPMANESVVLIITKMEDPEELDTRFSRFSPAEEEDDVWGNLAGGILEGADNLLALLGDAAKNADGQISPLTDAAALHDGAQEKDNSSPARFLRLFRFDALDTVCAAAREAGAAFAGTSILYKNAAAETYYLFLDKKETDELTFSRVCNTLSEYGQKLRCDAASAAYCAEHYEAIVKANALNALASL